MVTENSHTSRRLHLNELSESVIGSSFKVFNKLGRGFVEGVYENSLVHELNQSNLLVSQQEQILVRYDRIIVGEFYPDLIVEGSLIVEIKAVAEISKSHIAQCLNYIKATDKHLGLILNFGGSSVQVKRLVHRF